MQKLIYGLLALLVLWLVYAAHLFLKQDTCLDNGYVWDKDKKVCCKDCLTWSKTRGAIHMSPEHLQLADKCAQNPQKCDKDLLNKYTQELCLKYEAAFNIDDKYCDFDFSLNDCFKLKGNWQYPLICQDKKL